MRKKYQIELSEFERYHFPDFVMYDVREYIRVKELYIEEHEDQLIEQVYDLAYTSLKTQWVCGKISENTFWQLVSILKRGVVV